MKYGKWYWLVTYAINSVSIHERKKSKSTGQRWRWRIPHALLPYRIAGLLEGALVVLLPFDASGFSRTFL